MTDSHSGPRWPLRLHDADGVREVSVAVTRLVIAGWTGRDPAAIEHHIEELAAIGVPRPSQVPLFYRVAASQLLPTGALEAVGDQTSGEVEPVLVRHQGRWWLSAGSDHTDRRAEAWSVALSKQLCAKPVAGDAWPWEAVAPHYDALRLRSWALDGSRREVYQDGPGASLRPPDELLRLWQAQGGDTPEGMVMFCGTVPAIGGIRPAARFEFGWTCAPIGAAVSGGYDVAVLPVVS